MGRSSSLAVGCLVAFGLLACSDDDADGGERAEVTTSSTSTSSTSTSTVPSTTTASTTTEVDGPCDPPEPGLVREDLDTTVSVFVFCGDGATPLDMRSVDRVVPDDGAPLSAAVTQLLLGVTPAEADTGLGSAFSSYTAGTLRSAVVEDGVATLDLTRGFVATNNFSTSNMSAVVTQQISETVFQFPEISGLEFTIEGERWCGWEATCDDAEVPLLSRR